MAQTLLLGLGGTGSRVVNHVARLLKKDGKRINDGNICCAVLDTNENDNKEIEKSGVGVPVKGTSKAQRIEDYFKDYHHLGIENWCPQSASFLKETMIDGASEMRIKSRIGFLDFVESGTVVELEQMINDVLRTVPDTQSKIRIMIVSSLCGGTGSGMFQQVALWLREFLRQQQITIRGIFLLPDVFISTIKDVRDNKATMVRHYCNAYAAIRELNTITKLRKNGNLTLPEPLKLDRFFDSTKDTGEGEPVFDFAFFIDSRDQNGVSLNSISEYEIMVAQLVYMQLYAPMKDDMYSEEDNSFLQFSLSEEPLYGSCGTAKAEYPFESVRDYCKIRATMDALSTGWRYIDDEIKALEEEKKQREQDGYYSCESIDVRATYMKIFEDRASVKQSEAGKDRFFLKAGRDVQNETPYKDSEGKTQIRFSDKVEDFLNELKKGAIEPMVEKHSGTEDLHINRSSFVSSDHSVEELLKKDRTDSNTLEEAMRTFAEKAEEYATTIVSKVFPYSMGEVNANNRSSIYGLLTKPDNKGTIEFIHPVAARYVLYKLLTRMERELRGIVLDDSFEEALSGGSNSTEFDNKATRKTEMTPEEYLKSRKWYQQEEKFLRVYTERYVQYIERKIGLSEKYEKEVLQVKVYQMLITRVDALCKQLERFFTRLELIPNRLKDDLGKNIEATAKAVGKTTFVFGKAEHKEYLYRLLDFDLGTSDTRINKNVLTSVYGRLCAQQRPNTDANKPYSGVDATTAFLANALRSYQERIENNRDNLELIDLDIYTALCMESDYQAAQEKPKQNETEDLGDLDALDVESGEIQVNNSVNERHNRAFKGLRTNLLYMAAPFLNFDREVAENELGIVTTRTKVFWGFNPSLNKTRPSVGMDLGVNADLQADDAYHKNELYCYRAVYGLAAKYIPKFNESASGRYYTSYKSIVDSMVARSEGIVGKAAFVQTPHLDYNWHRILPYVTPDMDKNDELSFAHGFWLAVAYNKIRTDKDDNVLIRRSVDTGFGSYSNDDVPLLLNGKPVRSKDVLKLLQALQNDKIFMTADISEVEQKFLEELEDVDTYVGTQVMKGLMKRTDNFHPVDLLSRYRDSRGHSKEMAARLIGALESIAYALADQYNLERGDDKLEEAKYRICRKIYDSSKRVSGKDAVFSHWVEKFNELKIRSEDKTES